jgi:hypothetical protein
LLLLNLHFTKKHKSDQELCKKLALHVVRTFLLAGNKTFRASLLLSNVDHHALWFRSCFPKAQRSEHEKL